MPGAAASRCRDRQDEEKGQENRACAAHGSDDGEALLVQTLALRTELRARLVQPRGDPVRILSPDCRAAIQSASFPRASPVSQ
jgi:hypothetical protein